MTFSFNAKDENLSLIPLFVTTDDDAPVKFELDFGIDRRNGTTFIVRNGRINKDENIGLNIPRKGYCTVHFQRSSSSLYYEWETMTLYSLLIGTI